MKHHSSHPPPFLWEMPNHCLHFSTPQFSAAPPPSGTPAAPWHGLQPPSTVPTKSTVSPYGARRPSPRQPFWDFGVLYKLVETVRPVPGSWQSGAGPRGAPRLFGTLFRDSHSSLLQAKHGPCQCMSLRIFLLVF